MRHFLSKSKIAAQDLQTLIQKIVLPGHLQPASLVENEVNIVIFEMLKGTLPFLINQFSDVFVVKKTTYFIIRFK